jgi:hypothetical protein
MTTAPEGNSLCDPFGVLLSVLGTGMTQPLGVRAALL